MLRHACGFALANKGDDTQALQTYLGHSKAELTYWYLESVPELMREIAERCQAHVFGSRP